MFCPKCRAEYREGFTHCADCDLDLVDRLPEEAGEEEEFEIDPDLRFVEILRTNNLSDIAFIHSILGDAEINYFIKNERMISLDIVYEAQLMVAEQDEEKARLLLKDLDLKYNRFSARRDQEQE